MLFGGILLALTETRISERVSTGMAGLSHAVDELAKTVRGLSGQTEELSKMNDAPGWGMEFARVLRTTADAFTEFSRTTRNWAGSTRLFRVGLVLFFIAAALAIVDHSVAGTSSSKASSTTSVSTTTTTSLTTTTVSVKTTS